MTTMSVEDALVTVYERGGATKVYDFVAEYFPEWEWATCAPCDTDTPTFPQDDDRGVCAVCFTPREDTDGVRAGCDRCRNPDAIWWTGNTSNGDSLGVPVLVLETRRSYGALQARITPLGGQGDTWVSLAKLEQWDPEAIWVGGKDDTRERCAECGWDIGQGVTHYRTRDGSTHHCLMCHPLGAEWQVEGDSEPLEAIRGY